MSTYPATPPARLSVAHLNAAKGRSNLVALTAYTAPIARAIDETVDVILVGDSLGMVVYGMESTLPVTLDMMIAHGRAVAKATSHAFVVVDMPFGSYQASPAQAFTHAARVIQETGAQAVKLEGGAVMAETVRFLTDRGVPVMGHVALMPQHVHMLGGYRTRGRTPEDRKTIRADAIAIQEAGAFAVVLEGVEESLAREITETLAIPTIGIGASPACDGQVLVIDDMLGLTPRVPRFVKRYAALDDIIREAALAYAGDVRSGMFPGPEHCVRDTPKAAS